MIFVTVIFGRRYSIPHVKSIRKSMVYLYRKMCPDALRQLIEV